jgi:hypothetical protein
MNTLGGCQEMKRTEKEKQSSVIAKHHGMLNQLGPDAGKDRIFLLCYNFRIGHGTHNVSYMMCTGDCFHWG